jgi:general secretion pathway protein L
MRRFIGLDIGPTTIRAVRVARTFKGLQVQETVRLPAGPDGLRQLRAEGWGQDECVVASLPEAAVLSRRVELPFADPEKLRKVVPFELEELLPLALEDVAVEFELLSSGQGRAVVLAMAVPNTTLKDRLNLLGQNGFTITRLTVPSLALAAFYAGFMKSRDDGALLLSIDGDGEVPVVTLCAVEQGRIVGVRTFLGSRALSSGQPLWAEVQRTIAIWGEERGTPFGTLYLAGGESTGPTLPGFLHKELGVPKIERCAGSNGCDPAFVVAAGLAVLGTERRPGRINFAKNSPAGAEHSHTRWRTLAVGLCLILALASISLGLRYRTQHARHEQLATTVRDLVQQSFPEVQAGADATRQAKGLVAEARKRSTALGIGTPSLLELLSELTLHIPKDTQTEIKEVLLDADRLSIEAETDSFDSVERIKGELARSGSFVNVSVHDARSGIGGSRVRFRIQMTAQMKTEQT